MEETINEIQKNMFCSNAKASEDLLNFLMIYECSKENTTFIPCYINPKTGDKNINLITDKKMHLCITTLIRRLISLESIGTTGDYIYAYINNCDLSSYGLDENIEEWLRQDIWRVYQQRVINSGKLSQKNNEKNKKRKKEKKYE